MSAELKPCPCCGNEYLAIRPAGQPMKTESVYCDVCGCTVPRAAWNTRPVQSPAPDPVAQSVEPVARLLHWKAPRHIPVPHGGICARTFAEFPAGAGEPDGYWKEGAPLFTHPQPAAMQPVAWRWIPSDVWRDYVYTDSREKAMEAEQFLPGRVQSLILGPQPTARGFIGWASARALSHEPRSFDMVSALVYRQKQAADDVPVFSGPQGEGLEALFADAINWGWGRFPTTRDGINAKAREFATRAMKGTAA